MEVELRRVLAGFWASKKKNLYVLLEVEARRFLVLVGF